MACRLADTQICMVPNGGAADDSESTFNSQQERSAGELHISSLLGAARAHSPVSQGRTSISPMGLPVGWKSLVTVFWNI